MKELNKNRSTLTISGNSEDILKIKNIARQQRRAISQFIILACEKYQENKQVN